MKKIIFILVVVILLPTFLIPLTGCVSNTNYDSQINGKQPPSMYSELTEILNNTYFETDGFFNDMTFGEVIEELISVNPDENDITYKINENIVDFDIVKNKFENFDMDKYDYISALIGFNISDEFMYGDILFSVDKTTKDVEPIAVSYDSEDWDFSDSNLIMDAWL